ncbi:phosphoribosylanthranilate isomerase [Metallosphaera javensis (ex Sakai et al. 2022)]|uniref:phosphoribosylanthranilate isomerase n=1 Tax=Metallosphaera javensis (ex Sakai et al. 2022) TaxID=2775498 RepID=UPI002584FEDB|nr:MAG: N-(5'-phosphoribosyl)anthranilate isomerase [Metallosphaera javensis (ex Sakai et al. 2022)]
MTKIKICGIATLDDAVEISRLGVNMLGFLEDPVSPRYVKTQFLRIVRRSVSTPLVSVNVTRPLQVILENPYVDTVQVHRVLSEEELELAKSYSKKTILYVPSSERYLDYLRRVLDVTNMVLLDLERKGDRPNFDFLSKVLRDYPGLGVGGGISPDNVNDFLRLEPGWLDISRGVEDYPGKKNLSKVRKILEAIR